MNILIYIYKMESNLGIIIGIVALIIAIVGIVLGGIGIFRSAPGGTGAIVGPPGPPGPGGGGGGATGPPGPKGATGTFATNCLPANIPTCDELGKTRALSNTYTVTGSGTTSSPYKISYTNDTLIGIGKSNPLAPLHVGTIKYSPPSEIWGQIGTGGGEGTLWSRGQQVNLGLSSAYGSFSILANGQIGSSGFVTNSDRRIKCEINNIKNSDKLFDKLEPKQYKLIDENKYTYGLIAQDVKDIIPEAVMMKQDYIPNINQYLKFEKLQDNKIIIQLDNHDIQIGDKIKLKNKRSTNEIIGKIIDINEQDYILELDTDINDDDIIFVYGKEVYDYHVLDYNYLFTLNLDVTKKLQTKVKELESEIHALKNKH
jgi:hypothetical protein